ncbi:MAG: NAD(P)-dependent oxidoreductase [Chthoniobacter sp.]
MSITIWTNAHFAEEPRAALIEGAKPHRLIFSTQLSASNLAKAAPDPAMQEADAAFGQPDPDFALQCPRLRWIHLTTAGYTRYDGAAFRQAFGGRGAVLTNSSLVYNEPCAEHVLAFMMANARQLMPSLDSQRTDRAWPTLERRAATSLLLGQSVVLLGFGAIGHRLAELLAPFRVKITAVRRRPAGDENVTVVTEDKLLEALATADHVVNILPENPATVGYVHAARLAATKPGAIFYNVGRWYYRGSGRAAGGTAIGALRRGVSRRHRSGTAAAGASAVVGAELLYYAARGRGPQNGAGAVG